MSTRITALALALLFTATLSAAPRDRGAQEAEWQRIMKRVVKKIQLVLKPNETMSIPNP